MTKATTQTVTRKPRTAVTAKAAKSVKTQKAQAAPKKFFAMVAGARPVAGTRLFAHTHAALRFLGLLDGKSALRVAAEALMGKHAVAYHVVQKNMVATTAKEAKVKLTDVGMAVFTGRAESGKVPMALEEAFYTAISTGQGDRAHQISKAHLVAVEGIAV